MNYRERMLRQMWHNDLASKNQQWSQERTILQNDLTNLQNSVDVAVVEGLNKEVATLKRQIQALTLLAGDRKTRLEQEQSALLQLAQKKMANKKEAKELLTQLETNWNQDRDTWDREREELEEQHQQNLHQQETSWQNKADNWQEHKNLLEQQIQQTQEREQELNKISSQKQIRINYLESELNQTNQTLKQTQQDNQAKQTNLTQLQQDKTNLTRKVTSLTKTIREQLEKLNQKEAKLTQQKQTLEQLKKGSFSQAQSAYQELRNQINKATIAWGRSEIEEKLEGLASFLEIKEYGEDSEGGNYD